jgi:ubiquinone/menaquinone biosynthesis C-methylase UbiE
MTSRHHFQYALLVLSLLWASIWPALAVPCPPALAEAPAAASFQEQAPPASTHYLGRELATTMHYSGAAWLVRESRQREEDCKRLLEELDVRPGQVVCDLGCGNGFFTLALARLTGKEGKVYAVDIQREMLQLLHRRAREAKIAHVVPVLGTVADPRLPEDTLDLVLLVDVYHEFSHPAPMLRVIRKSLKPHGRIALAEFRAEDDEVPIKPLHKMSKQQILREFTANGFKLTGQFDGLPWQHLMFFSRDDQPQATDEP